MCFDNHFSDIWFSVKGTESFVWHSRWTLRARMVTLYLQTLLLGQLNKQSRSHRPCKQQPPKRACVIQFTESKTLGSVIWDIKTTTRPSDHLLLQLTVFSPSPYYCEKRGKKYDIMQLLSSLTKKKNRKCCKVCIRLCCHLQFKAPDCVTWSEVFQDFYRFHQNCWYWSLRSSIVW